MRVRALLLSFGLVVAACGSSSGGATTDSTTGTTAGTVATSMASTDASPPTTSTDDTRVPAAMAPDSESGGPPPESVAGRYANVAVVGCSQTRDAMAGYAALNDGDWGIFGGREEARYLSGGSIERWTSQGDDRYWDEFARWNGAETDALWIQVCWATNGSQRTTVDHMGEVVARAFEIIGHEVPVFISGLNDWDPRDLCPRGDYELSWQLAEEAVAAGYGALGPDPGTLTPDLTDDGCHGNEAGDEFMGGPVAEFFG